MRLYSNSKRGLRVEAQQLKFETRLRLQNSKQWESPKLELSKSQNSRIYESLKPIATRFDSIEFVPLSRPFLASQASSFRCVAFKPGGCDSVRSHVPSFYKKLVVVSNQTRDHVNSFITSHLIGSISYSVHGYTNQNSLNSFNGEGIAHRFKKCVTETK